MTEQAQEMSVEDKMLFTSCNNDPVLFNCHKTIETHAYQKTGFDTAKQVYEWIKTGHINLKQFKHIANRWNLGGV